LSENRTIARPDTPGERPGRYHFPMQALLECRPILHSSDIEETRAFLAARAIRLELLGSARDRAAFAVRYNGIYLKSMWMGYIRYGSKVAAYVSPSRGDYWVHFPLHGRIEVAAGWDTLDCDPLHAAVTSPFDTQVLKSDPQTERLSLSVHGDALMRHLAVLLDDAPRAPLRLPRSLELEEGFGCGFARLLHAVADDFCRSGMLSNPLAANDFEQFVMTSLLLSLSHNYSDALRQRETCVAPRDVRRASEYIREHAAEPITLADLVQASGVAGRTLLQHFRDFYGVSPMRYLRNHRLQRVRDELLSESAGQVSEIASRWGFAHLGRFAAEYRRRFGECPSVTRARGLH
jgi:AraC-like DNA-binding protein